MSWVGQMPYGTSLVSTLKRGDLSAYYPIIRASLTGKPLTPDQKSQWRFYGDPSTPIYDRGQF